MSYCIQNEGDCNTCSLNNYGRDCCNNPIAVDVVDGYCESCNRPVIYCEHAANHFAASAARLNACKARYKEVLKMEKLIKKLTYEQIAAVEIRHSVYINRDTMQYTHGERDDNYGWMPVPPEWIEEIEEN